MGRLNWGGLVIGAIAGLGVAAAVSVVLFIFGLRLGESTGGDILFALVQFGGLLAAGFVGARFSPGAPSLQTTHGALAALLFFAVSAAIALGSGSNISVFALVAGGVVALILGSAGGALAVRD